MKTFPSPRYFTLGFTKTFLILFLLLMAVGFHVLSVVFRDLVEQSCERRLEYQLEDATVMAQVGRENVSEYRFQ